MDEPTAGLDAAAFRAFWDGIEALRRAEGTTVVLTTHRPDEAERCDRLAVLARGAIVACERPDALRARVAGDLLVVEADEPEEVGADARGAARARRAGAPRRGHGGARRGPHPRPAHRRGVPARPAPRRVAPAPDARRRLPRGDRRAARGGGAGVTTPDPDLDPGARPFTASGATAASDRGERAAPPPGARLRPRDRARPRPARPRPLLPAAVAARRRPRAAGHLLARHRRRVRGDVPHARRGGAVPRVLLPGRRPDGGPVRLDLHDRLGDRGPAPRLPPVGPGGAGLARGARPRQVARLGGGRAHPGGALPRARAGGGLPVELDRLAAPRSPPSRSPRSGSPRSGSRSPGGSTTSRGTMRSR